MEALQVWPDRGVGENPSGLFTRLQEYFPRQLSFGSDALYAFEGILRTFSSRSATGPRSADFMGIPLVDDVDNGYNIQRSFAAGLTWRLGDSDTALSTLQCDSPPKGEPKRLFPSWTWAAYKSANPNATKSLIFECTPRSLVDGWGLPLKSENAEFSFSTHAGEKLDLTSLSEYLSVASYDSVLLSIEITTWTFTSRIESQYSKRGGTNVLLCSCKDAILYLDDNWLWPGEEVKVLYMGVGTTIKWGGTHQLVFLLVRETTHGTFSRVGVWCANLQESIDDDGFQVQEALDRMLQSQDKDHGIAHRKETLWLV